MLCFEDGIGIARHEQYLGVRVDFQNLFGHLQTVDGGHQHIGEYQTDLIFQLFVAFQSGPAIFRHRHAKTRRRNGCGGEADDDLFVINYQYDIFLGIHRLRWPDSIVYLTRPAKRP